MRIRIAEVLAAPMLVALCNWPAQSQAPQVGPISCDEALTRIWNDRANNSDAEFEAGIAHALSPATTSACGSDDVNAAATALGTQIPQMEKSAQSLYMPARRNLLNALQNYSSQQQETSSTSSTASVTPVPKPAGASAISEEFTGISVSSGTSALTFTFAPGTVLKSAQTESLILPCSPVLRIDKACVGSTLQKTLDRLTLSVSANTSTAGQSIKGTATSTSTSSSATQVTLSTAGTTEPSFGGFGVKAVAFYAKSKGTDTAKSPSLDVTLSSTSAELQNQILNCTAFDSAQLAAAHFIAAQKATKDGFLAALHSQEITLGKALLSCLTTSSPLESQLQNYLAAVVVEQANNEDENAGKSPLLGFEYDLNTPANQPSYSSMKANLSLNLGSSTAHKQGTVNQPVDCNTAVKSTRASACAAATVAIQDSGSFASVPKAAEIAAGNLANKGVQNSNAKSTAADETQPVTVNISVAADLYNSEPSSSIPSASHLRDVQAGVEIDLLVPISKWGKVGGWIGDGTLAGTYYYQDQTSPSILKGPPSTITISNLPPTATQVYTTRGPINLGQIRFGLGTGTNVKFPICFTYANRSELIAHPIKGLQFGFSYNLSSLFTSASKQ